MSEKLCASGHVISPGRDRCERCNGVAVNDPANEVLPTSTVEEAGKVDGGEDTAGLSSAGSEEVGAQTPAPAPESAPVDTKVPETVGEILDAIKPPEVDPLPPAGVIGEGPGNTPSASQE